MREKNLATMKTAVLHVVLTVLLLGAATAVGYLFRYLRFPETATVLVYLLAVLLVAWQAKGYLFGFLSSIIATFAYNYFFTEPHYTLEVRNPSYWITFTVMTVVAVITSTLTSHAKRSSQEAREKAAETKAVYNLTYRLSDAKNMQEITGVILGAISEYFYCTAELLDINESELPEYRHLKPLYVAPERDGGPPERKSSYVRLQKDVYADEAAWPILGRESVLGIIRIPKERALLMSEAERRLLRSMVETTAMAMERLREAEKNIKARELAEQERYRGNLLRAISHDLRTPLSGIIGTSEMLMAMTDESDPRHALIRDICTSADWLHAMVENILSLTRLDDGRLLLEKQPEAAEEVVDAAVNHVLRHAPEREIAVKTPEALLLVPMDATLIRQVLINLLDNALKHTAPEDELSVTVDAEGRFANFTVLDGGTGIAPDDLPNIFQPFYTTAAKQADAGRGIGLGLAICQAIVKAHGGAITARNRPDHTGAEFKFSLPLEAENEQV
ncbi:two-component system, OmpR family, sensor histidine kinase KdpD [Sporobacter termitidis DSM 10068]|uniref:histidine kinase n=1 Tax=Sporobacter termitidis DSM 10068 TaxID=1123282 RepID=A0A1M5XS23_9FIRM|nr:DUF4118 domain-containing protein [Sporobacter termitidis]SHI02073.1 two-component system, OmpR family, sensor histidine kinase KdpD [Sporobacter termitidis DSM 10068]